MISENDVRHVASLARIHLKDDEVASLQNDLKKILTNIDLLKEVDVTHVEPSSHSIVVKNVVRDDVVTPSLSHESISLFAIELKNNSFKVPKVIE